tara:strand:- start:29 stop:424 length:396 start_codon:yes stop_codon:yes gene_type:complete
MAASLTTTNIVNGSKRLIVHGTILSDGDELANEEIYDFSGDSLAVSAAGVKINQVWFSNPTAGGQIFVEFVGGSADKLACGSGFNGNDHQDFRDFGGIPNHAASPTGDISITTKGFDNLDQAVVILDISRT